MNWQPIETAPKDGRRIIAWFGANSEKYAESVYWLPEGGCWVWSQDGDSPRTPPTHWMPLPEPPK
jgi:hypothetical protein